MRLQSSGQHKQRIGSQAGNWIPKGSGVVPDFFSNGFSRIGCSEGASLKEFRLMVVEMMLSPSMPAITFLMAADFPVPAMSRRSPIIGSNNALLGSFFWHYLIFLDHTPCIGHCHESRQS